MSSAVPAPITVALLGGGTVGSQVARLLIDNAADLAARVGAPLELIGVAVRDIGRARDGVPAGLLTDDPAGLVERGADIVVEVMGGIEPARSLILAAMAKGSSIVTANKALLAADGGTLYRAAELNGVDLYFEASVAGAIPLLRPLRESLAGDRVNKVLGIVNGTTNFILSKMEAEGADYAVALAEAQALGYAEADPTADVGGHDAAAKAAILAELAFHTRVTADDVSCEGITGVTAADVEAASPPAPSSAPVIRLPSPEAPVPPRPRATKRPASSRKKSEPPATEAPPDPAPKPGRPALKRVK